MADEYSEDFESPRAAAAAAGEDYSADFDESYSAEFDNASDDDSLTSWQSLDRARAEARNVPKKRQRELEALMVAVAAAGDRGRASPRLGMAGGGRHRRSGRRP